MVTRTACNSGRQFFGLRQLLEMPPHRLAEKSIVRVMNFTGSCGIGKLLYCVSTNDQPYTSRWLSRTLLDNGLACLEGISIAEVTRRFDCPAFPLPPPKAEQTKRLNREHLHVSALNTRPQPRFTSTAAHDPSARSVPLRLRVGRSVQREKWLPRSDCAMEGTA
jgi:hypothetical protein